MQMIFDETIPCLYESHLLLSTSYPPASFSRLLWYSIINLHHCIRFFSSEFHFSSSWRWCLAQSTTGPGLIYIYGRKDDRIGEFSLTRGALCSFLPLVALHFFFSLASRFPPQHLLAGHSCIVFSILLIISSAAQEHRSISSMSLLSIIYLPFSPHII